MRNIHLTLAWSIDRAVLSEYLVGWLPVFLILQCSHFSRWKFHFKFVTSRPTYQSNLRMTIRTLVIVHFIVVSLSTTLESHCCFHADDLLTIDSHDIGEDLVQSYSDVRIRLESVWRERKCLPGGTCRGISASFETGIDPFFNGHSRSTLGRFSQRSCTVLMRVMYVLYLTFNWTLAPSSMSSVNVPLARMDRVCPL